MIVGFIPAAAFFIASLLAAIWSAQWGAVGYTAAIFTALVVVVGSCACVRVPDDSIGARKLILSSEQEKAFKKYYAFFRFPFGTQNFAHFVNFARIFAIIWIGIGLWLQMYWVAAALVGFYLISNPVMWWLSPIAHYKAAAEKGHSLAAVRLAQIEHILENRNILKF